MVLVAARSVFELFSADEETFANSQLWKNLLRRTCTVPLWSGERGGRRVEVWGNASAPHPQPFSPLSGEKGAVPGDRYKPPLPSESGEGVGGEGLRWGEGCSPV
jgi:hypothetical protein